MPYNTAKVEQKYKDRLIAPLHGFTIVLNLCLRQQTFKRKGNYFCLNSEGGKKKDNLKRPPLPINSITDLEFGKKKIKVVVSTVH